MKLWLGILILTIANRFAFADGLTQIEAQQRSSVLSQISYEISLNLQPQLEQYKGHVTIHFNFAQDPSPSSLQTLNLDFIGGSADLVSINGKNYSAPDAIARIYDGNQFHIPVSKLVIGANSIYVSYQNNYEHDGSNFNKSTKEDGVFVYTDLEPYGANHIFPCFDQPDLKATYTLDVTAPANDQVISNTRELQTKALVDGTTQWFFPTTEPFATYLFHVNAGPYTKFEDNSGKYPLRLFVRPTLAKTLDPKYWFGLTQRTLAYYEQKLGVSYHYNKLDQIIIPDYPWLGMENIGAITYKETYAAPGKMNHFDYLDRTFTIAHEISHMWFGGLVTPRWWDEIWENESFTDFQAFLATAANHEMNGEEAQHFFQADYQRGMVLDDTPLTHAVRIPIPDTDAALNDFDDISYGKGGASLAQVYLHLGDAAYYQALHRYFTKYSNGNTVAAELMTEFSQGSNVDFNQWAQSWLDTSGPSVITPVWTCDKNGKINSFILQQTSDTTSPSSPRRHELVIGFMSQNRKGTQIPATISAGATSTTVDEMVGRDCPTFVYANLGNYDYSKTYLDDKSAAWAAQNIQNFTSGLTRQMLEDSLWRQMNDQKWNPQSFAMLSKNILSSEENIENLIQVASHVSSFSAADLTLSKMFVQAEQLSTLPRLQEVLLARLLSETGIENREILFASYIQISVLLQDTDELTKIYNGASPLNKLPLSQSERWILLEGLASLNAPTIGADLKKELGRDSSDEGKAAALRVQFSSPDTATKIQWIQQILGVAQGNTASFTIDQASTALSALNKLVQPNSVTRLADTYFSALTQLTDDMDSKFVTNFTQSLFPSDCTLATADRTQAFLQSQKLIQAVQNQLKINILDEKICAQTSAQLSAQLHPQAH